ncbi:MAG: LytTR family transcriptional regulator [Eubacteriales bacterium]|nr:LytTR family transcriptional regulator [Eubacteriales bacterium]
MAKEYSKNITDFNQILIQQSSFVFHFWFDRDIDNLVKLLDPNFVWIGSYEFQYTKGIDQFLEITKEEQGEIAAQVFDEEYNILFHEKNLWIVHGCFSASAWKDKTTYLYTRQRATFVWKYTEENFKLLHLHCTMARDVPLEGNIQDSSKNHMRWFEYMQNAEKNRSSTKSHILIRDINGSTHYILPSEIIYVHINYHIASVYTGSRKFDVRQNLNQLLIQLPFLMQIHKSWLVNPVYIVKIQRYYVTTANNDKVPIGKSRYNEVCAALKRI